MTKEDTLEACTDEEIVELVPLLNRAFAALNWHSKEPLYIGPRTSDTRLRQEMAHSPQGVFLQWKREDQRLGCVFLSPIKGSEEKWYLGSLSVEPSLHGGGMGQQLLSMAEEYAQQRNAKCIQLTVVQLRLQLVAWYQRRGYQPTGEIKPFPYGTEGIKYLRNDMHFIVMQKNLS